MESTMMDTIKQQEAEIRKLKKLQTMQEEYEEYDKKNEENKKPKEYLNTWKQIEDTPFHLITTELKNENREYRLAIGRHLVTEKVFTTTLEAIGYLGVNIPWDIIMNLTAIMINKPETIIND